MRSALGHGWHARSARVNRQRADAGREGRTQAGSTQQPRCNGRAAHFTDESVITTRNPMLRKSKPKLSKSGFVAVRFAERQYGAV